MTSWIGRVVATSARHPFIVVLLSLALTAVALVYSAGHFAMTTDTAQLISTKNKWRQHELAYERAFPSLQWLTIVVIDGATPELAEHAASRLSVALAQNPALFHNVRRPDGGPFFDRNGLLFLPLTEVQATTDGLLRSQFLLASLAADPSLRGVLATLSRGLQGVQHGQAKLADFQPLMAALADTIGNAAAGRPAWFSWQDVMSGPSNGTSGGKRQTRRVLIVQPVLDYSALQPGLAASNAIRTTARSLDLDPAHGVTIRLTGPVPLSDEEFASLAQDSHLVAMAMVVALLGILWWAVHSGRVVFAILLATFMGLLMTTGLGLLVTGRFNLISVAFIPLFVGLGIDFSIQFSVRFLAERHFHPGDKEALAAAGRGVGLPLALAAAAIGAGFFAFLPTDYIGVAELGLIAGLGMVIAFALTITLLPALLALLRPAVGALEEVGFAGLAPVEAFLRRNHRAVLAVGVVVALVSAAALPFVRFDFNPLHLKSAKVESMSTLADLATDPDWTPDTINVLAPSLAAAEPLERRLAALPEVSRIVTLQSFVPGGQPEKLALIRATAQRLGPALDVPAAPSRSNEGPTDEEVRQALVTTASALRQAATDGGPASQTALRLADALDRLQQAPLDVRAAAAMAIAPPLGVMLAQVRALLQAGPVTVGSLPADIVSDWIAKDGRARIQLFPRAGLQTDDGLWRFAQAVQAVAPDATGVPISIRAAGDTIVVSFLQAGAWSFVAITLILAAALRRVRDVVLTMVPVLLSALLTFATSAALDLPLNFANIIALPLLFGVGVAFNIYFVMAWRAGETAPLQSSLMRAVVFSALTTATAFGALWLSSHPGTASMGRLLMISLGWELLVTLLFRPALLAAPPADRKAGR